MSVQSPARAEADAAVRPPTASPPPLTPGQWLAAVALGAGFIVLTALAVRHVELKTGRYITTGVPPVPAVASLLLLLGVGALLRRVGRRGLDRRQVLLVFSMTCVGALLCGQYTVRAFLPHLVSIQYWKSHGNSALVRWSQYVPDWYAPADADAIRRYFEGSRALGPEASVPWALWSVPLLRWSLFFVALFVFAVSLTALLRRQWIHHERLSFPLLYLPLTLTSETTSLAGGRPLFRSPLFWGGISVTALFNGCNIGHALNPVIPGTGFYFSFAPLVTEPMWRPFATVQLFFMLEAIGFGYFVPLEISFSAWFFYLAEKLMAVTAYAGGYEGPGFPYMQDQSAGAFVGVAALVLFGARRHLAAVARATFGAARGRRTEEEREERAALLLLIASAAFILAWGWFSGFSLVIAGPFFAVVGCFALVYARLRAETGAPFEFVYPYGLPKEMVVNAFTPRGVLDAGGPRSWVAFSSYAWLSRHHFTSGIAAHAIDGLKLADESRLRRRQLYGALGVALIVGLAASFWAHLGAFYDVGANMAGGGRAEYRSTVALQEFQRMATLATTHTPRDMARVVAECGGAGFAVVLGAARTYLLRSPFHPLGYLLATAYGDHTTLFFPMLVAWVAKSLVLRAGGLRFYRAGIPFFLGLILGTYVITGIFWPLFSLTLAPEASQSFHIYLGG